MASLGTITVTLSQMAKQIDHSLLPPNMTDAEIQAGLDLCSKYKVASACVKPYSIPAAVETFKGTDVKVCAVIGFPHGNSTTEIKVLEAVAAVTAGATEIDMVVNVGKVLGKDWGYVAAEIAAINTAVESEGAILKVIFENDFLQDEHIVELCKICTKAKVAFVKTSTGYGFVKRENGMYSYNGATVPHVELMRKECGPDVKIKAAGGVRTVDEFLYMMKIGTTRIGTSGTAGLMEEAKRRGIGEEPTVVELKAPRESAGGSGY
ncbi:deoxyribose-phosphate aldolase [Zalerion maritima]|uniref:deoxyribose-phosphate aldolase n=1 Tax=Zalerion maritima TaxID=339359 RepID=A0AAD5RM24_9PEZI|nr:deoxyribose-phosphate aldolase [Zalerion maritima]